MLNAGDEQGATELRKRDLDPDPIKQFARWYDRALASELILPNAMTLATATSDGRVSARMVLLKDYDDRGFTFYTNYESQKGRELEENPNTALVFYWSKLDRQVRITGRSRRVSREESEAYFRTRPFDSQLSAWVSKQSRMIENREALEAKMRELTRQYEGEEVPLPPYWGGYRVSPDVIEFWQNRPGRLHDRFRYTRGAAGDWLIERLAP
jgi:pyridoxamine 5'-phosphate oxidase